MISIITLFACMDVDKNTNPNGTDPDLVETPDFVGMDFLLESSEGYQPISERVSLGFPSINGDEIEFQFDAGCNSMGGTFLFEDGIVNMDGVWMTEMGCEQELMEEDDWFVDFWTSGVSLGLDGDLLRVSDGENTFYFRDSEVVTPDMPLVDTFWVIDTFIEGEAASNYNLSSEPSIQFHDDGTFSLDTGCNSASGTYDADASSVSVRLEAITEAACVEESGMNAEEFILDVMEGDLDFSIDASRMFLMNGARGLGAVGQ